MLFTGLEYPLCHWPSERPDDGSLWASVSPLAGSAAATRFPPSGRRFLLSARGSGLGSFLWIPRWCLTVCWPVLLSAVKLPGPLPRTSSGLHHSPRKILPSLLQLRHSVRSSVWPLPPLGGDCSWPSGPTSLRPLHLLLAGQGLLGKTPSPGLCCCWVWAWAEFLTEKGLGCMQDELDSVWENGEAVASLDVRCWGHTLGRAEQQGGDLRP